MPRCLGAHGWAYMHRLGFFPGATASMLATWFQAGEMMPTCLLPGRRMRIHELLPIMKWLLLKYHRWPSADSDNSLLTKAGSFSFFLFRKCTFSMLHNLVLSTCHARCESYKDFWFFLSFAVVQAFPQPLGNLLLSVKSFLAQHC